MLPDKKKTTFTVLGIILFIIVIVIFTSFITSILKKEKPKPNNDDNYPANAVYVGIKEKDDNYEKLVILDKNFKVINNEINSFYDIKDINIKDNFVIFYSDSLNKIAYDKKEKEFYVKEIESYINDVKEVKLGQIGLAYLDNYNDLTIRYYDDYQNGETIDSDVLDGMTMINDSLYYYTNQLLKNYDLKSKKSMIVVEMAEEEEEINKKGYERIIRIK